jgi:osmotically-inducible protein OsmY
MMRTNQAGQVAGSFRKSGFGIAGLVLAGALQAYSGEFATSDTELRRAAEDSLRTNPYLGVFDHVLVDIHNGRVRLQGSVELPHRRQAAAARVAKLPGVIEVWNDIEVQSSAPADVQLRRRLFERLYYGGGIEPSPHPEFPVRILVSDGRVTLAGAVASSADSARLEAMAWDAGAGFVENRLKAQHTSIRLAALQH